MVATGLALWANAVSGSAGAIALGVGLAFGTLVGTEWAQAGLAFASRRAESELCFRVPVERRGTPPEYGANRRAGSDQPGPAHLLGVSKLPDS